MVSRVDVVSVLDEDEDNIVEPPRDEEAELTEGDIVEPSVDLFVCPPASRLDNDELGSEVEATSLGVDTEELVAS